MKGKIVSRIKPQPIAYIGDTIHKTLKDFHSKVSPTWLKPNPDGQNQEKTRAEKIIKQIKKLDRRIKKAKSFLNGPETAEMADLRLKVLKWETLIKRHIGYLLEIQHKLKSIDKREISKYENKQAEKNLEMVRLERGKLVPRKSKSRQMAEEKFAELQKKK